MTKGPEPASLTFMETLPNYSNPDCIRFVRDMIAAGREDDLRHYRGRNFYEGPAVSASLYAEVMADTKVKCMFDSLGRGFIVHPIAKDAGGATEEAVVAAIEKATGDQLLDAILEFGSRLDEIDTSMLTTDAGRLYDAMYEAMGDLQSELETGGEH